MNIIPDRRQLRIWYAASWASS